MLKINKNNLTMVIVFMVELIMEKPTTTQLVMVKLNTLNYLSRLNLLGLNQLLLN